MARPFDRATLAEARALAARYRFVIEQDDDAGDFFGATVEMPHVFGQGNTIARCFADIMEATAVSIATCLELGKQPPGPARDHQHAR